MPGLVNFLVLELEPGTSVESVAAAARAAIPRSDVHTGADFAAGFADLVSAGFLAAVGVLVGIGLVVGGAVVALTTYTATVERAREYGVLKAVGASPGFLYRVVLQQSVTVGILGSLLGTAAAIVATRVIESEVPEFITELRAADVLLVLAVALLMAALAAVVPVRRINRIDPGIVFRA